MTRVLPRSEYHRLPEDVSAFLDTMNAEDAAVVVVEDGAEIVARMVVMRVPHWECFWMAPEKAGNAGVTRALLSAASDVAEAWSRGWFYANADNDAMFKTLERLGGEWMPMHTFVLRTEESCLRP